VLQSCTTQEPKLTVIEDYFPTNDGGEFLFAVNFRKIINNYDITIIVNQGTENSYVEIRKVNLEKITEASYSYPQELKEINTILTSMKIGGLLTPEEVVNIRDTIQLIELNRIANTPEEI